MDECNSVFRFRSLSFCVSFWRTTVCFFGMGDRCKLLLLLPPDEERLRECWLAVWARADLVVLNRLDASDDLLAAVTAEIGFGLDVAAVVVGGRFSDDAATTVGGFCMPTLDLLFALSAS